MEAGSNGQMSRGDEAQQQTGTMFIPVQNTRM